MEVRKEKCSWCERTYAVKDSTAFQRNWYCSEECEAEYKRACTECEKWWDEIRAAWDKLREEYEPEEDEDTPCYSDCCTPSPDNKRMYLAFKKRYQKWKTNHCWKKSFWAWDEDSDESLDFSFGGGGIGKTILNIIVFVLVIWLGWTGIKCGWKFLFGGGDETDVAAARLKGWQQHLEQRCDAFDDGMSEKEVEAKGLRNYTWDEWQEKFKKEQESQDKKEAPGTTRVQEIGEQALSAAKGLGEKAKSLWQNITSENAEDVTEKWNAHQAKRRELLNQGVAEWDLDKMGYGAMTFDEFKARFGDDSEAKLKKLNARIAELEGRNSTGNQQSSTAPAAAPVVPAVTSKTPASAPAAPAPAPVAPVTAPKASTVPAAPAAVPKGMAVPVVPKVEEQKPVTSRRMPSKSSSYNVTRTGDEAIVTVTSEYGTRQEAWQAAFRKAVEGAVSSFVGDLKLLKDNQDRFEERLNTVSKADIKRFETLKDLQVGGVFTVQIKAWLDKKSLAPKFKDVFPRAFDNAVGASTVNGQQNGAGQKASKDSKGIRIIVEGKGKTKETAVSSALRQAVWKTVCTWVDSKTRTAENRDKMLDQVKTITEADVSKFEVIDTQEQNGEFVIRVRVSVSKKKIAPKFAEIFPDVFGNEQ